MEKQLSGKYDLSRVRARLRVISTEIGRAHLAGNDGLCALLYSEKALHQALMEGHGGTGEILAQAQLDAAKALAKIGVKREALAFYRKAFVTRAKVIRHLVSKSGTIKEHAEDIARLRGILVSYPDKVTRAKIEEELRRQGLMLPGEILRYEVNVEEVKKIIARLERQKRSAEHDAEFAQSQLERVKSDLSKIEAVIKRLKDELETGA
jgi:hypothetical protein